MIPKLPQDDEEETEGRVIPVLDPDPSGTAYKDLRDDLNRHVGDTDTAHGGIPRTPEDVGAAPEYHTHGHGDITGLSDVAVTGNYEDLSNTPDIPSKPEDIDAARGQHTHAIGDVSGLQSMISGKEDRGTAEALVRGHSTSVDPHGDREYTDGEISRLSEVSKTGHYDDLEGKPSIPTTPGEVGADPAGSASIVRDELEDHANKGVDAHGGIVSDGDPRLTDARHPLDHDHTLDDISDMTALGKMISSASTGDDIRDLIGAGEDGEVRSEDIVDSTEFGRDLLTSEGKEEVVGLLGLSPVAESGSYSDLSDKPSIPTGPSDIGAAEAVHGHSASDISGLSDVATSGSYGDLSDKPTIPSTAGEVGAEPAGAVMDHSNDDDPHGDRAYAESLVDSIPEPAISASDIVDASQIGVNIIKAPSAGAARIVLGISEDGDSGGPVSSDDIIDSTKVGRDLLTSPSPSDARQVLELSDVAKSGDYSDLSGVPTIPSTPSDIGAADASHSHQIGDIGGLTDALEGAGKVQSVDGRTGHVSLEGVYEGLGVAQSIVDNLTAGDVGAEPAGAVTAHVEGMDPHGDRAYTDQRISEIPEPEVSADDIIDASSVGKGLLTSQSESEARSAIDAARADHAHGASDVSGLSSVATSGEYEDLDGKPYIPATADDIDAAEKIHRHDVSDVDNLASVAVSGEYEDLQGAPDIPSEPGDIGAARERHTHPSSDISGLSDIATSGDYGDLSNTPIIPSEASDIGAAPASHTHTPGEVGSDPSGTAQSLISDHESAEDPHGDREYAETLVSSIPDPEIAAEDIVDATPLGVNLITASSAASARLTLGISEDGGSGQPVESGDITDSTATGRALLTASNPSSARQVLELSDVASTGSYESLSDKPSIPEEPSDIGAEVEGAAASAVGDHLADDDPHGDRAYADEKISEIPPPSSSDISDATQLGIDLITSPDADAARGTLSLASVAHTGDYGDLSGAPSIPSAPGDIGAAESSHTHQSGDIDGLHSVATTGDYGDLGNKPIIPLNAGDIGAAAESHEHAAGDISGLADIATSGSYSDLTGAPVVPSTPEQVGADPAGTAQGLIDDLADVAKTGSYGDLQGTPSIPTEAHDIGAAREGHSHSSEDIDGLADVAITGSYNHLINKPTIPSSASDVGASPIGHGHDASSVTGLPPVAVTGSYQDLTNKPTLPTRPSDIGAASLVHTHTTEDISDLAPVAASGDYEDLSSKPTIPSTPGEVGADPAGTAQGLVDGLADVAVTGSYSDLMDTPQIPSEPGDVGAASAEHIHDPSDISGLADVAVSGSYSSLTNKPTIPTTPGQVGAAPADHMHQAGDIEGLPAVARSGQYSDLAGKPQIPSNPQDIGAANVSHGHDQSDIDGLDGALNMKADLVGGVIPTSQIPALATTEVYPVESEADMLNLNCQRGDIAIRTDESVTFILAGEDPANIEDWTLLPSPGSPVTSVQGQLGDIVLGATDVGAAHASHTHAATEVTGLASVAKTGAYQDLTGKPSIPSTPGDIGAEVAGQASNLVAAHSTAADPHKDRAYTDAQIAAIPDPTSSDISDSTAIGRSLITSGTAANARATLGLASVASTGSYADLVGKPSIPSAPGDIGAAPSVHSHSIGEISGLPAVAVTGDYDDLGNKPAIPTTHRDVGAHPERGLGVRIDAPNEMYSHVNLTTIDGNVTSVTIWALGDDIGTLTITPPNPLFHETSWMTIVVLSFPRSIDIEIPSADVYSSEQSALSVTLSFTQKGDNFYGWQTINVNDITGRGDVPHSSDVDSGYVLMPDDGLGGAKWRPLTPEAAPWAMQNKGGVTGVIKLTQLQYDAIPNPDPSTLYVIVE